MYGLNVSAGISNLTVSWAGLPSTILVSPSSTTNSSDTASGYALVPYGQEGTIVATASFSTAAAVPVSAPVLEISCLTWSQLTPLAYEVRAQAVAGAQAVESVPVSFAVVSPVLALATIAPATALVDDGGSALTLLVISPEALDAGELPVAVEASAGGGSVIALIGPAPTGDAGSHCL